MHRSQNKRCTIFLPPTLQNANRFLANIAVVRLSVCCLSVMLLHPTQAVVIFSNVSTAFGTLAIC